MRLDKIAIFLLKIPFRMPISHNLARRSESEAIIVVAEDDEGRQGYGEGAPRQYVTGETTASCLGAAAELAGRLVAQPVEDFAALTDSLQRLGTTEAAWANPSAWCALELAVLDLWARGSRLPLWKLLGGQSPPGHFTYSAILPLLPEPAAMELLGHIASRQLQFVKIKVNDRRQGIARLKLARRLLGPAVSLRVDANGAFSGPEACKFLEEAASTNLAAFEQPVAKDDLAGLKAVSECGQVPVIADESCCTSSELATLAAEHACQGINIRLAKCGGLLKGLDLWRQAQAPGLFCQIGCHVGETAILSAAGRHLAALCPEYRFLEGSLSRYVLAEDLTVEDITFGERGRAPLLTGPGLGVSVDEGRLARWGKLVEVKEPNRRAGESANRRKTKKPSDLSDLSD